jgi:hypothetical protein
LIDRPLHRLLKDHLSCSVLKGGLHRTLTMVLLSMPLLASASSQALAHDASTPEAHLKLADYYRAQSKALREESSGWAAMAAEYDRNPASHPIPKFPTYGDRCRTLSRQSLKAARKAEAMALAQERLATPASH